MAFNSITVRPGEKLEVVIGLETNKPFAIEGTVSNVFEDHVDVVDVHNEVHLIPYKHIRTKVRDKDLVDPPIQIHALKVETISTAFRSKYVIGSKKINVKTKYEWKRREAVGRVLRGILAGSISVYDLEWTKFALPII